MDGTNRDQGDPSRLVSSRSLARHVFQVEMPGVQLRITRSWDVFITWGVTGTAAGKCPILVG